MKKTIITACLVAATALTPVALEAQTGTRIEKYVKSQMTEQELKEYQAKQAAEQAGLWAFVKTYILGL